MGAKHGHRWKVWTPARRAAVKRLIEETAMRTDKEYKLPPMDAFTATMIAEGAEEASEKRQREAWQYLVDTGLVWQLQGFFGRQAAAMIAAGTLEGAG